MRNPLRTEDAAFQLVLIAIPIAALVAIAGIFGGGWAAFGVLVVIVLALLARARFLRESDPPEQAAWAREQATPADGRQLIVVANETLLGAPLHAEIRKRLHDPNGEVLVVAPALNSRLRHWTSDTDAALAEARERLRLSLAALERAGIAARGEVGSDDPVEALVDALRSFRADEVIISTHPPERSNWLERDVVAHAKERVPLPIEHVVVDLEHDSVVIEPPDEDS